MFKRKTGHKYTVPLFLKEPYVASCLLDDLVDKLIQNPLFVDRNEWLEIFLLFYLRNFTKRSPKPNYTLTSIPFILINASP